MSPLTLFPPVAPWPGVGVEPVGNVPTAESAGWYLTPITLVGTLAGVI